MIFKNGAMVFLYFNPHSPSRGVTLRAFGKVSNTRISIHTPLAGSDNRAEAPRLARRRFQSTLPARGVTRLLRPTSIS